jgi:hypothetical protein
MLEFAVGAGGLIGVGGLTGLPLRLPVGLGFLGLMVGVTVAGVVVDTGLSS